MSIRNKLLLATTIPITLLIVQVLAVNIFIRELQSAVQFIGTTQKVIETNLQAVDQVAELGKQVKLVPQIYVQPNHSPNAITPRWEELSRTISNTKLSRATESVNADIVTNLDRANARTADAINALIGLLEIPAPDMDALLVNAINCNAALIILDHALSALTIELRQQLQSAVDRERKIHNRPIIAGAVIGGFAVLLLMLFIWIFIDRGIIRRLSELSNCMLALAKGNLDVDLPVQNSNDEIAYMTQALNVFRDNAVEIRENNLREIQQARRQRQFWLEHMATFLRHELKNKQVGAEQSIRLLANKQKDNPQVIKYCERASASLSDMKELINGTVDATDIESALISENFTTIDLSLFLHTYVAKANEQIAAKIVMHDTINETCAISGDPYRLEQMLDKLVSNAMDFRTTDTEITVRLSTVGKSSVSMSVENVGPMLQEDTQALFGLSFSDRSRENKQPDNVGFGLFVARRIAEYHSGTLDASNANSGPVFTITLPLHSEEV